MTLDLPELRRLLAEATAGPWRRDGIDVFTQGGEIMEIIEAGDRLVLLPTDAMALTEAEYTPELHAARWAAANASQAVNDAALIVALRNAAPELLAAAEERDRLARLVVSYAGLTERVATEGRDWREIGDEWSKVLAAARAALAELPVEPDGDPDWMCPNCLTPWKCNWPHILEPES